MTNAGLRVFIQALYGLLIFGSLLYGALGRNNSTAFIAAALGVLAVVLSQTYAIDADRSETSERAGIAFWWASIILAGISAVVLVRG